LSIGSGNARVELEIAKAIGETKRIACFDCLELAAPLVEQANNAIEAAGFSTFMRSQCVNVVDWSPNRPYDVVMANHSLHHIVELESLFETVVGMLPDHGIFVSADMIGRNGHQRWPEALSVVRAIWKELPDRLKIANGFPNVGTEFDDRDFSRFHNEGVRAQDILPLLLQRFRFKAFVAEGGIIDPFIERVYGYNYNMEVAEDLNLIDRIGWANDLLIESGTLKPTMMWAVMQTSAAPEVSQRCHRGWTAEFCVRLP
jgi:SAM-dependent methyltransferase